LVYVEAPSISGDVMTRTASLLAAGIALAVATALPPAAASAEAGFNAIRGTDRADVLAGTDGRDTIRARDGRDHLLGKNAIDLLRGGDGDDYSHGGGRSDFLSGGADNDMDRGGNGGDYVLSLNGNDVVVGGHGDDWLVLGRGKDRGMAGEGSDAVIILNDHTMDEIDCGPGRDVVAVEPDVDAKDTFKHCERTITLDRFFSSPQDDHPPVLDVLFELESGAASRAAVDSTRRMLAAR
jgi:hypothetical protein